MMSDNNFGNGINEISNLEELSYQDNSMEIIGNNWESLDDESMADILVDFNEKENRNIQSN